MSADLVHAEMNAQHVPSIGECLPVLRRHVTQAMIDDYAKASGDFNPIHVDPEFASQGPFGRTIAHGMMTLVFVAQMLNEWSDGAFDNSGEVDVTFIGPVFAGDTVEISGIVEEVFTHEGGHAARVKLICRTEDRDILAGKAIQVFQQATEA